MNSKYRSSAADQKNPKVCRSDQTDDKRTADGRPWNLQGEIAWEADIGSGVIASGSTTTDMNWDPLESAWQASGQVAGQIFILSFTIHPDGLHGRLEIAVLAGGIPLFSYLSPWVVLESVEPLDTGFTRAGTPSGDIKLTFQISG